MPGKTTLEIVKNFNDKHFKLKTKLPPLHSYWLQQCDNKWFSEKSKESTTSKVDWQEGKNVDGVGENINIENFLEFDDNWLKTGKQPNYWIFCKNSYRFLQIDYSASPENESIKLLNNDDADDE